MSDIIAAISTGNIRSAIGIVRMSGDNCIVSASCVFRPSGGRSLTEIADRKLVLGDLLDKNGHIIDKCMCTVSHAPNSYTGEDTAEFHCHGSPVVLSEALDALFANGARQALPGEFTKRAFLNGKMDLTEAEAVIDLIDAETSAAAVNAAGQLGGAILTKAEEIYSSLLDIMSHFHAVIDWPDEDIEEFELRKYGSVLSSAEGELSSLLATFERGRILKDGIKCAIIGKPNVGKSSLLNALLGYERAIVTPVAGTTRDTVEERIRLNNIILRLIDTAGLHETANEVEELGIERSIAAVSEARLVIAVFDGTKPLDEDDLKVLELMKKADKHLAVINKADLPVVITDTEIENAVFISALNKTGIDTLSEKISNIFPSAYVPNGEIITNVRQADEIKRAKTALESAKNALAAGVTPDAVLTEIEEALASISALTGKSVREDIVSRIFERFCVGK